MEYLFFVCVFAGVIFGFPGLLLILFDQEVYKVGCCDDAGLCFIVLYDVACV